MKAFNAFFIVIFIIFAALQYNDPDPYIWIPIYLYVAYLCYLGLNGRYNRTLYLTGFAVYFAYAAYLFIDKSGVLSWWLDHNSDNIVQSMKAEKPWIEETREFFGLVIVMMVMGINMVWLSRRKLKEIVNQSNEPESRFKVV